MSKSLTTLSTFVLLILATQQAIAFDHMTQTQSPEMVALDAISLSIEGVSETQHVVDSLLTQKTLWLSEQTIEFLPCVEGLTPDLTSMTNTLQKLKDLISMPAHSPQRDPMALNTEIISLKKMMTRVGKTCSCSVENVNNLDLTLLTSKLDTLPMLIYGVVYHVSVTE